MRTEPQSQAQTAGAKGHGHVGAFLAGALILLVGSLLSRLLGGVYHFVLPILMGGGTQAAVGMGLLGMAYPLYNVLLSLSAVGVPLGVSKMVAEAAARGRRWEAARIFRVAAVALAVLGAVLSVVLFLLAQPVAIWIARDPRAAISIRAIAPAVFFVSLESAYRGLFQGLQHMAPQAASQVVEQIIRVLTMFALAVLLLPRGIAFAAAGASFGAVTGAAAGLAFLAIVIRRDPLARAVWQELRAARAAETPQAAGSSQPGLSTGTILARLTALVVPIALAGMVLPMINVADAVLVPLRLHAAGLGASATALYGVLVGYALPFMVAPSIVTTALAVSLVPSVSEAMARGARALAKDRAAVGMRVTLLLTVPAAVGLFVLAGPLPQLLYHSPVTARPLAVLAWGVLFLGLQQTSTGVLQGMGLPGVPVVNLLYGGAVKVLLTWWLVAIPGWNVTGAALATVACFAVASLLNVRAVQTRLGPVLDRSAAGRVLAAAAVMGIVAEGVLRAASHHRLVVGVAATVVAGVAAYLVALAAVGGVRRADVESLPRVGKPLSRALTRMHLVRE
ncbi:MAG TPA: polysaccharide biosynthesis protein [Bacillota bacterium]|nr:polysaccharide biosynthesis protein [Bacillota bacterium]